MNRVLLRTLIFLFAGITLLSAQTVTDKKIADLEQRLRQMEARLKAVEARLAAPPAMTPAAVAPAPVPVAPPPPPKVAPEYMTARLLKKDLQTDNGDYLALLVEFANKSFKPVSGFSGELLFRSLSGDTLVVFQAEINRQVDRDGKTTWYGGIPYTPSNPGHVRFLNYQLTEILSSLRITAIHFADGSSERY